MPKLYVLLAVTLMGSQWTSAQRCGVCQEGNDAQCIDQTSFYNCMNNATMGRPQNCKDGYVCSNTDEVCVKKDKVDGSTILDVCGGSGSNGADCGVCGGTNKYSCVSSFEYARCVSGKPSSSLVFECESGNVCVISALNDFGNLCVPNSVAEYLDLEATCTNPEFVPPTPSTTPAPATTPNIEDIREFCRDAAPTDTIQWFYVKYDCSSSLYCQRPSGTKTQWIALYIACSSDEPYYDTTANKCVKTKPADCDTTTTTTLTTVGDPGTESSTESGSGETSVPTDPPVTNEPEGDTSSTAEDPSVSETSSTPNESTDDTTDADLSTTTSATEESSTSDSSSSSSVTEEP